MPIAWITEYRSLGTTRHSGAAQCGLEDENQILEHEVTFDAVSGGATPVFHPKTRFIRIDVDTTAHIKIGEGAVADSGNKRVQANLPEYFGVIGGTQRLHLLST